MFKSKRKLFSYSNVVATLALVFAMSGGALAATHYLINSTKQINPKVLKKLKGNVGKTGKEGPAGKNGTNGATGPQGPEGVSGVLRWRTSVATSGASFASPNTVVLAKVGPFTVTGHCYTGENGKKEALTKAATYISTSETGSFAQGYSNQGSETPLTAGEDLQISEDTAEGLTGTHEANYKSTDDGSWGAETATGALALNGFGNQGVWLRGASGPACSFAGYLLTE
jgi:hypothetical protein